MDLDWTGVATSTAGVTTISTTAAATATGTAAATAAAYVITCVAAAAIASVAEFAIAIAVAIAIRYRAHVSIMRAWSNFGGCWNRSYFLGSFNLLIIVIVRRVCQSISIFRCGGCILWYGCLIGCFTWFNGILLPVRADWSYYECPIPSLLGLVNDVVRLIPILTFMNANPVAHCSIRRRG